MDATPPGGEVPIVRLDRTRSNSSSKKTRPIQEKKTDWCCMATDRSLYFDRDERECDMPRLSEARKKWLTTMMKETIFEAATSVLCEHGVNGATMNRVAAAAKLSKSSLYDYFRSKEELLRFVCDRITEPVMQATEEIAESDMPAPQKLETILRAVFEHLGSHQRILGPLVWDEQFRAALEPSKQAARSNLFEVYAGVFEQGMDEGVFRSIDPAQTARMFMACVIESCEVQVASGKNSQIEQQIEALLQFVLHGVSAETGGREET
jgi:TetR/AcrR family transcriptional regulator, cholesterol catabolism regulator